MLIHILKKFLQNLAFVRKNNFHINNHKLKLLIRVQCLKIKFIIPGQFRERIVGENNINTNLNVQQKIK